MIDFLNGVVVWLAFSIIVLSASLTMIYIASVLCMLLIKHIKSFRLIWEFIIYRREFLRWKNSKINKESPSSELEP